MAGLLFFFGTIALWFAQNAFRRPRPHPGLNPLWVLAMLTGESAAQWLMVTVVATALMVAGGGLDAPIGWVGLTGAAGASVLLAGIQRRAARTLPTLRAALGSSGITLSPGDLPIRSLLRFLPARDGRVRAEFDVGYHRGLTLDLYRPTAVRSGRLPVYVHVHGGSWMRGNRRRQGRPLLYRLAAHGWLVVVPGYPLSPAATFPEHLIALKRAIAWVRTHNARLQADPDFVAIGGGSAGAHLAAMVALTAGDRAYQPGFETADTSVSAAVGLYGIYDLLIRHATRPDWPFVHEHVMKSNPDSDPELYRRSSPYDRVHRGSPPFLLIAGERDSLVPATETGVFARQLGSVTVQPLVTAEVPGGNHGFDYFWSVRGIRTAQAVEAFLEEMRARSADRAHRLLPLGRQTENVDDQAGAEQHEGDADGHRIDDEPGGDGEGGGDRHHRDGLESR